MISRVTTERKIRRSFYFCLICISVVSVVLLSFFYFQVGSNVTTPDQYEFTPVSRLWIVISAALVFLMQAGFAIFEVGMVNEAHGNSVGVKNLLDWVIVSVIYFVLGFKIMFGISPNALLNSGAIIENSEVGIEFFLFQLAFAGTSATIVSGALAERTHLLSYLLSSLVIGLIIYPLFGNWAWGTLYPFEAKPFFDLAGYGFHDFAGSTVVHSIGGWFALGSIVIIGPRRGRFRKEQSSKSQKRFLSNNMGLSVLGVFILWFGWWGFNGGSLLQFDSFKVSKIILNTTLSAASAGFASFIMSWVLDYYLPLQKLSSTPNSLSEEELTFKEFSAQNTVFAQFMGGTLGGLVVITASCDVANPIFSLILGIIAGTTHNLFASLLNYWKLDDPVGAIPVHGWCGALGTIAVAFCPGIEKSPHQFMVQVLGVLLAFSFAAGCAVLTFKIAERFQGLKLSNEKQQDGRIL